MQRTLLIALYESPSSLAARLGDQTFDWFYFGTGTSRQESLARQFGRSNQIEIGTDLNRIAHELRQPFLDWIVQIGMLQKNKVNWWCSRLASKSPLQTDFFVMVCYVQLMKLWVKENHSNRTTRLVIVEDSWLYVALKANLPESQDIHFLKPPFLSQPLQTARWLARGVMARVRFTLGFVTRMLLSRLLFPAGCPTLPASQPVVVLFSWIEDRCFTQEGCFRDWYTGRLDKILIDHNEQIKRLSSLCFPIRLLFKLRRYSDDFIVSTRHIDLISIFKSAFSRFEIDGLTTLEPFQGLDCRSLLLRERWREIGEAEFAGYRLWYLTARKIAKRYGCHIKSLIYPFENQPWEKLLCMSWNQETPQTLVIGYQHSSFGSLLLGYFLGRGEASLSPLPQRILASGRLGMDTLVKTGYAASSIGNGGALRHEHLHHNEPSKNRPPDTTRKGHCVLVVLPTAQTPAAALIQNLIAIFQNQANSTAVQCPIQFLVKCHSDLPFNLIFRQPPKLPDCFTIEQKPLSSLFETADLFLYVPPTSACWDAYFNGLKILKYQGDFLDIDYAEVLQDRIAVCSKTNLQEAVLEMLHHPVATPLEFRQGLLHDVFSPVNEAVWIKAVNRHSVHAENTI